MLPQFPIYIPSKGRWDIRLTSDVLTRCGAPHTIVVEESQYEQYRDAVKDNPLATILILDEQYKRDYDLCDDLGFTKSTGPGPARNFIWDHSIDAGHAWHWTMDDNIKNFLRYNHNKFHYVHDCMIFRAMEGFCLRYKNVYMAGPNYFMFVKRKSKNPPLILNTRIYSCNLIRNDIPYRWRSRYNEDTDLSLRILKDGFCTVQFCAFLQEKTTTQHIKGGNTEEFYAKEGTLPKSQMQVNLHPDVSRIINRYSRIHHYVDYSSFKKNKLQRDPDVIIPDSNPYEMELVSGIGVRETSA